MVRASDILQDLRTIERALTRSGYDEDGYNAQGFDKYGRSREMMERFAQEEQAAFESLTPKDQATVQRAMAIAGKLNEQAAIWEKQPQALKKLSPFYENYMTHSDITKHATLVHEFASKEEWTLILEAANLLSTATHKLRGGGGLH